MKLKCQLAATCDHRFCPHKIPHTQFKPPQHPQCNEVGAYCFYLDKAVKCVPIKVRVARKEATGGKLINP